VSDAQGSLRIRIKDEREIASYRQGSGIADCLVCRTCGVLVGACYRSEGRLYASVNSKIVALGVSFGAEQPVSPKKLSDAAKIGRWQDLWFSDVALVNDGA
jgi:hypothetical protein